MSESYSVSDTSTFTITHAKHIAAKVATDLKRIQRLYDSPSDHDISKYEMEIIELLKYGFLSTVTYGFRRENQWIEPTLRYSARDLFADFTQDDDPGRIRPGANIEGATFYSYLTYSSAWNRLSTFEKETLSERLPVKRTGAPEPSINGYLTNDRLYSAGSRALSRDSVRSPL